MTAALAVMVACGRGGDAPSSASTPFLDPEGKPIVVAPLPVHRIASTTQLATEWVVLLGKGDLLVSRTDYDREPELAALPSIGGGLDPSAEAIAALRPDVVMGWHDRSSTDLFHTLRPFHIPVISFETTDTADVFANLHRIGILVGESQKADSLGDALRGQLRAIQAASCPNGLDHAPTVFLEVGRDPPMTAGRGTWMDTILGVACLRNVFGDLTAPWPQVSLEAIAARNPDWILTSTGRTPGARLAEFRARAGWRDLEAVKAGRVLEIPGDLFARGGASIAEAARAIVAAHLAAQGR